MKRKPWLPCLQCEGRRAPHWLQVGIDHKINGSVENTHLITPDHPGPLITGGFTVIVILIGKIQFPYTSAKLNLKSFWWSGKNSFIALPGKGGHSWLMPSKLCPYLSGEAHAPQGSVAPACHNCRKARMQQPCSTVFTLWATREAQGERTG